MKGDYVHFSFLIFWFVHISLLKKWVWLHIWNKIAFWFYLWNLKRKKKSKEGNHLWLSYWFEFSNICLILKAFSLHLTCKFFSQICKSPQKFHVKLNSMVYSVLKLIFHVKCYLYMTVYHQSEVTFCSNMYRETALWNFNFDLQR